LGYVQAVYVPKGATEFSNRRGVQSRKWKRESRINHPRVIKLIQQVPQSKKKKLKHLENGGESRQDETKSESRKKEATNMTRIVPHFSHLFTP